jgi:hypothetical protein
MIGTNTPRQQSPPNNQQAIWMTKEIRQIQHKKDANIFVILMMKKHHPFFSIFV